VRAGDAPTVHARVGILQEVAQGFLEPHSLQKTKIVRNEKDKIR
jgi:hypothetical protein